jgi:hypothetical protein
MLSRYLLAVALFALAAPLFADSPTLSVDFSKATNAIHMSNRGSFDGPLPEGCRPDYPNWNNSVATTSLVTDEKRSFLRLTVSHLDQAVLLRLPDTTLTAPGYYVVETLCRCAESPLNVHIRQIQAPFHSFWSHDIRGNGANWITDRTYVALETGGRQAPASPPWDMSNMQVYLSFQSGVTDVASVTVTKTTKAAMDAAVRSSISRPPLGQRNFFRNSRFPLGVQTGWSIGRDNIGGTVQTAPSEPGPSGFPSLKISSETPIEVFSEPFQTSDPDTTNRLTFAVKGTGQWSATIIGRKGDPHIRAVALAPSDRWTTATLDFQPDPTLTAYAVVFRGTGTLYLDSLTARAGTSDTEYASAGSCEVALSSGDHSIDANRIQFLDEPAVIDWCVTGDFDGATLKSKVVNAYGEERPLPDILLHRKPDTTQAIVYGTESYDAFKSTPLGPFRIEAWVECGGVRVSPINEAVMTRIRKPYYWGQDAPLSPFGNHFLSNRRTVTAMKAAGVNWERLNDNGMKATCWGYVEPEPGKWTFDDTIIANYRAGHIKVLGYLGTAPKWASYFDGYHLPYYLDLCSQPRDLSQFENYVKTTTAHFKGVIDEYDIENEPFSATFWHRGVNAATGKPDAGPTPAADYAALAKVACAAAKQVDPQIRLNGICTTMREWSKAAFDAGAYDYCDNVAYHWYTPAATGYPGDVNAQEYENAIGYIAKHAAGPLKPIVLTEGNPTRAGDIPPGNLGRDDYTGMYKNSIPWKSDDDLLALADSPCRYAVSELALGVKQIFYYGDFTYTNLLSSPSFPVLLGADGYPHPALAAFSNMAWLVEGRHYAETKQIADNVFAVMFSGRGGTVAAISGPRYAHCVLPRLKGVAYLDLFGNPLPASAEYSGTLLYAFSKQSPYDLGKSLSQIDK